MSSRRRSTGVGSGQMMQRRRSLTASVRRSSRALQQNAMNDLNIHLGRVATVETPTNRKERWERRSSRKEGFERIQSSRSERMENLKDQWTSHRKSFVCEVDEIAKIVENNPRWTCCGFNLCCTW